MISSQSLYAMKIPGQCLDAHFRFGRFFSLLLSKLGNLNLNTSNWKLPNRWTSIVDQVNICASEYCKWVLTHCVTRYLFGKLTTYARVFMHFKSVSPWAAIVTCYRRAGLPTTERPRQRQAVHACPVSSATVVNSEPAQTSQGGPGRCTIQQSFGFLSLDASIKAE